MISMYLLNGPKLYLNVDPDHSKIRIKLNYHLYSYFFTHSFLVRRGRTYSVEDEYFHNQHVK